MHINYLDDYDNYPSSGTVSSIYANTLTSDLLDSKKDTVKNQKENAYEHQTSVRLVVTGTEK